MLAKREREREKRERERERARTKADPGRENRAQKDRQDRMLSRTCRRATRSCQQGQEKKRKKNPGRPPERRRRRRRGRERETDANKTPGPENGEKHSLQLIQKPYQNAHPKPIKNNSRTGSGVHGPKPFAKTRRNKNRTPKNKAKKGRTFCRRFRDAKTRAFQGPKSIPKNSGLQSQSSLRKTFREKNLRRIEL